MNTPCLCAVLLALLLAACTADTQIIAASPPAPLTEVELRFQDSLEELRADYDSLRLWEALARARRLNNTVAVMGDSVRGEIRAEFYQYFAMLHFHHWRHHDSIVFYAEQAATYLPTSGKEVIHSRQLLLESYRRYQEHAFIEAQMYAQLGRKQLEKTGDRSLILAWLCLIEARARKQQSYDEPDEEKRGLLMDNSISLVRHAISLFQEQKSPWLSLAQEHLVILLARHPTERIHMRSLIDSLVVADTTTQIFGFRDRLLGIWHRTQGQNDSAQYYYTKLLTRVPTYYHYYNNELFFVLERIAAESGEYEKALRYSEFELRNEGCCGSDSISLMACVQTTECSYYLSPFADIYYRAYQDSRSESHLVNGHTYAQAALKNFERWIGESAEEAVLQRSMLQGPRIVDKALQISAQLTESSKADSVFDGVLRSMETGRTFLLIRDLMERQTQLYGTGDTIQRWLKLDLEVRAAKEKFVALDDQMSIEELSKFRSDALTLA
ncbi:MAG: hypothetical protein WA952_01970, partial [Lewinella sp.]